MDERGGCNNPEYREMISAYIDGDLDAAERQILLAHLATCDDCRATLDAYRQIGGQLRALPPVAPPMELRDAIYAATVDTGQRKLYIFGSRLGYSVAALAAVVLIFIVAIYLIVNGYQRSIDPAIVASQPGNNVIWPLSRPIEITFNKEMDRESVEAALSISPASERDRLTRTWDGNTLILGANQTLRPDTTYSISITKNAEDRWGSNLGSEFKLQFESSDSFALQTPEPLPSATPTPPQPSATPTVREQEAEPTEPGESLAPPTATDDSAGEPETPSGGEQQPPDPGQPTATAESTSVTSEPDNNPPPATPTPTQDEPDPQPTETAEPSATPTERPSATPEPTLTPRPLPTATATAPPPTATPEPPTPTATPETVPVVGPFGNVYWGIEIVVSRLGAPEAAAYTISAIELDFQHGAMLSRSDTSQTYVLESGTAFWSVVPSSSGSSDSAPGPIEDTWIPGGSLGALWEAESWIQAALGHALAPSGQVFESRVQSFEHGAMLMSASGQIYVLYDDGTWELYPDPGA